MKKYIEIFKINLKANYASIKAYPKDFLIGNIIFLISNIVSLIVSIMLFKNISSLHGWNYQQILLLQCYYQFIFGIIQMFSDNLWDIAGKEVNNGMYDEYIIKPVPTLFLATIKKIDFNSLGSIINAIIIFFILVFTNNFKINYGLLILSIPLSLIIIYAIEVIIVSLVFKFKKVRTLLASVNQISEFCKYPILIYPLFIQFILVLLLPFATAIYLPFLAIFNKANSFKIIIILLISALILMIIAIKLYHYLEKKYYSSSGN